MSEAIIRQLRVEDIPQCLHIARENWSEQTAQIAHIEFSQAFIQAIWRPIFYVAERYGEIVGTAAYHASWMTWGAYDLTWINARRDIQRQGIGRALVNRCLQDIRAVGTLAMLATKTPDYYARWWGFMPCFEHCGDIFMRLNLREEFSNATAPIRKELI